MANYDVIATVTLSSGGNFSFTSIPSTYKELHLMGSGASQSGVANCTMTVNGSSSNIYSTLLMYGSGNTAAMDYSGTAGNFYTGVVNQFYYSPLNWRFMNYKDTNFFKNIYGWGGHGVTPLSAGQTRYEILVARTGSAISSIQVGVNGSVFEIGSQLTLYGLV
jgi:hypothetical protein